MARYINADALMKKLNEDPIGQTIVQRYNIDGFIEAFPTVDVVEVKHGRWKMTDAFPHRLYCDQCFMRIVPNANWIEEYNIPTNFCPNCGADMREETEDDTRIKDFAGVL